MPLDIQADPVVRPAPRRPALGHLAVGVARLPGLRFPQSSWVGKVVAVHLEDGVIPAHVLVCAVASFVEARL